MLAGVVGAIVSFFYTIIDFFKKLFQEMIIFVRNLFNHTYVWLEQYIPQGAKDIFTSLANFWNDLDPVIDAVTYFVPVWGILGVIIGTYYVIVQIRVVRWLLGLIPTLNLG